MTRNEKIAEVMGWECPDPTSPVPFYESEWFDLSDMNYVKLLQRRMVEDGWNVLMMHTAEDEIIMSAWKNFDDHGRMTEVMKDEQSAIVELFCKVYGIK